MKRLICYLRTIKEFKTFIKVLIIHGAIYVAHAYVEKKSYIKDNKIYIPLVCQICGHKSVAWREL